MLVLCYHNGAMGHVAMALFECCTQEGNRKLPSFLPGQHLHHFQPNKRMFDVQHPHCDVQLERQRGNKVVCSGSRLDFGKFLVLTMGLSKWEKKIPQIHAPAVYKQQGSSYGEQLEILSLTLRDKVYSDKDWYVDTDVILDVMHYWNDHDAIRQTIRDCGFTPIDDKIDEFCESVTQANQIYYDDISVCFSVVDDVIQQNQTQISLSFWQMAVCYAKLLNYFQKDHRNIRLLNNHPTSTQNLIEIFYE